MLVQAEPFQKAPSEVRFNWNLTMVMPLPSAASLTVPPICPNDETVEPLAGEEMVSEDGAFGSTQNEMAGVDVVLPAMSVAVDVSE